MTALIGGIEKVGALLRWPRAADEDTELNTELPEQGMLGDAEGEPPSFPIEDPHDTFTSLVEGVIKTLVEKEKLQEQTKETKDWVKISITTNEVQEEELTTQDTSEETEIVGKGGEEWVNALLKVTWPHVSQHICSILRKTIEPALQKSSVGAALRLSSISLGEVSPTLSNTSISTRKSGSLRINTNITWDTEVALAIDAGPVTSHVGVSAGIDHIKLSGLLSLVFGPPCDTAPYFNALQIFFPNKPHVDFRLSGLGMLAGSLPGVSCAIQSSVDEALAKVCVLPEHVSVILNNTLSPLKAALSKCPPPEGVLHLKVVDQLNVQGTQGFLWGDDSYPTTVRIRQGNNQSTSEDGVYLMIYCPTQEVVFEVLDQRDQVMCSGVAALSGCSQTLTPDSVNVIQLKPAGMITVHATWNNHPKENSPQIVTVALSDSDIRPPPPTSAAPLVIRVSCAGGDSIMSSPGTARWSGKSDQTSRNDLLTGSIDRLTTFGVSNNVISEIVGLTPSLIADYSDAKDSEEPHALDLWLHRAKKEFELHSSVVSPHFSEVVHLLVPHHCDAASLELVGADGIVYGVYSTRIDNLDKETQIYNMQPTEESVGTTVCTLKASISKTELPSCEKEKI